MCNSKSSVPTRPDGVLVKLDLSGINLDDISQAPHSVFGDYCAVSRIHGQEFPSRPQQKDDATNIRLAREKGKSKSRLGFQPETRAIRSDADSKLV